MKKHSSKILAAVLMVASLTSSGQTGRLHDHNTIGWYNYFGTFRLNNKFSIHSEYQWRRTNFISDWQQSLLRIGINYQAKPGMLFRLGYGWIETFPYGDIPINGMGKDFTEHRIFEMIQLNHKEGKADLSHRFMLEQRFLGRYSAANLEKEDEFPLLHRARYMFRFQLPLKGKTVGDKTAYLAMYDEVFIGFGENVGVNVFDQNRLGLLLGYRINKTLRLEAGYLNQLLQLGRLVNNRAVFQHNNGIILNMNFSFDMSGKQ